MPVRCGPPRTPEPPQSGRVLGKPSTVIVFRNHGFGAGSVSTASRRGSATGCLSRGPPEYRVGGDAVIAFGCGIRGVPSSRALFGAENQTVTAGRRPGRKFDELSEPVPEQVRTARSAQRSPASMDSRRRVKRVWAVSGSIHVAWTRHVGSDCGDRSEHIELLGDLASSVPSRFERDDSHA